MEDSKNKAEDGGKRKPEKVDTPRAHVEASPSRRLKHR